MNETNTTKPQEPATPRRPVYLTGFGKFCTIVENPTTFLVQQLASDENVTEARVLEVSAEGSLEDLAPLRTLAEPSCSQQEQDRPCAFVHLGVNAGSSAFALERCGYNLANFRIPDERGWVAQDHIIDASEQEQGLTTAMPLEDMLATLQTLSSSPVGISIDPGRYICNFVYFHSLKWVKNQAAKGHDHHLALFLHVPEFSVIPADEQLAFVRHVITLVAAL